MDLKKGNLTIDKLKKVKTIANSARGSILKMTTLAKSGHPGGSMSSLDFLTTLYHMININPENPENEERDRVIISHGHISPGTYSVLGAMGFFDLKKAIAEFRLSGSIFEGHVEPIVPGVEWATGNLGQGLSAACGFALAGVIKNIDNQIFVLMGDGEQQKGQLSEARRFAAKYNLKNITAFVDYNQLQISGDINKVMPQNIAENYISDGWKVIEIDGHDLIQIRDAILDSVKSDKPTMILAHTVMGKGVSFMENKEKYHGSVLSEEQLQKALDELGLNNDLEEYRALRENFKYVKKDESIVHAFDIKPGKNKVYKESTDNRSAWGTAIAELAAFNENPPLVVFDCDLQGSVKTSEFEKVLPQRYIQGGIMEHNTAVVAAALSKENMQVFFVDFGVFGVDETYNQHRLSDINETNLKIITTHVGLDVGEDGKTHQCLDYLGIMKNLYHFKIIIPADPNQTDRIIRYLSQQKGNYLVSMGRSKLDPLRDINGKIFYNEKYKFSYGKMDLLREGSDAALLVMGTLTSDAVQVSEKLKDRGISLQVWNVSCPSDLDEKALKAASETGYVFTYEDHNVNTGLGNSVADKLLQMDLHPKFEKFGVEDYAFSGHRDDVIKMCELDAYSIEKKIAKELK